MFYSHDVEASRFHLFATYISTVLNGRDEYRNLVDAILEETHSYSSGQKNIYKINKAYAPLVIYLNQADSSFFDALESKCIKREDYKHVYEILSECKAGQ